MKNHIIVNDLVKKIGDRTIVDQLSFSVSKGQVFGLLGSNGAGKTTTIECILGIKKFNSGQVEILGEAPGKNRKTLFQKIGVQLQASSYQNNIKVAELCEEIAVLYDHPKDYKELLETFHLSHYEKQPVEKLSGGEKQKLSIILALIPNPEIIFLDELTTGLDTEARREVWGILKKLKASGITIFLTTHYMEEAEALCDYLYLINRGKKVIEGTVAELIEQSGASTLEDAYLYHMEGVSYA
ncbi:ABC transporter ATP-binding protein [Enterococcus sp. BWM-S5]|uniref:ABC transporter ATP-binding protein n=1 Tax=Enterococcus larvae TaxID=2794352 RepID=A0ABS4CJ78_9ENTE|nr:ABC transporter ATP-binding protein [Enterococcus larvae]MBP1046664.1 ABC transporter ATP-binding protein [Enterococcus larvae]